MGDLMRYEVIVMVRDPNRRDTEHRVIVEPPPETPRDLHGEVAARIACGKVRATIAELPHLYRITVHGIAPAGDVGNAGNPASGATSGRKPIDMPPPVARAPNGRFVSAR
jgi:hypothetical protein